MLKSVLIANRGEIACRVMTTARRLGIRTIAVYSDADVNALHVRSADEAVHIGPSPVRESYLVGAKIIAAAKQTGAEAIHPGYGFLSEDAEFAQAVQDARLIWVGPNPASITAMGLKDAAKKRMQEAGVPTTPGYLGDDQSPKRLKTEAERIGYPVLIKAVAGGGGKGMRKVDTPADFEDAFVSCKREAVASFGNDVVLLEKWVTNPRHIEVQVFGDTHGDVVHLFERDCSLQRRHQKVIEEAPAPGMDAQARAAVCQAAVNAAKVVDYVGAGTIEFITDGSEGLRADRIWFTDLFGRRRQGARLDIRRDRLPPRGGRALCPDGQAARHCDPGICGGGRVQPRHAGGRGDRGRGGAVYTRIYRYRADAGRGRKLVASTPCRTAQGAGNDPAQQPAVGGRGVGRGARHASGRGRGPGCHRSRCRAQAGPRPNQSLCA